MAKILFKLTSGEEHPLSTAPYDDDNEPFKDLEDARVAFKVMFSNTSAGYRYFGCDDGVIIFAEHIESVRFEA